MFKDLSMESENIQTKNCAPIQCLVWPRKEVKYLFTFELTKLLTSIFSTKLFVKNYDFDRQKLSK